MNRAEALRSIHDDLLEYIQSKVKVEFDNARQRPVSCVHGGETYRIHNVLGRFMVWEGYPINGFLISSTEEEVYFLYFQPLINTGGKSVQAGYWILSFRVLNDNELMALYREDRKMLIDIKFKRVVDFHGHLCPDLVLGGKLCEYVQKLQSVSNDLAGGISIIAENSTSALDAIQIILGTTVGNQRLHVTDFGKHNYTLLSGNKGNGFKFALKRHHYGDEAEYDSLERKIRDRQVVLDDLVQFQTLLDSRVKYLMGQGPEDLYLFEPVTGLSRPIEAASVFLDCDRCGQQVLESRIIHCEGKAYCLPCFQRLNTVSSGYSLQ
jgi:formylmethanofuran dehydrogenase subunit E